MGKNTTSLADDMPRLIYAIAAGHRVKKTLLHKDNGAADATQNLFAVCCFIRN
jgi:hypothetical protein